jgi:Tfp pilus assembly protein PilE
MLVTFGSRIARRALPLTVSRGSTQKGVRTHPALRRGFALVRLLFTVAVVALLATFLVRPRSYSHPFRRQARQAGRIDLSRLDSAERHFRSRSGRYGSLAEMTAHEFTLDSMNTGLTISLVGMPAGATGYAATLTSAATDICGIHRGDAPLPAGMPPMAPADEPVCWP